MKLADLLTYMYVPQVAYILATPPGHPSNIQISCNLWVLWQFSDEFGISCILHENFTEYDEFLFCGAGELSFWMKCYFETTVGTVCIPVLHDLPIGSCMVLCKNVSR